MPLLSAHQMRPPRTSQPAHAVHFLDPLSSAAHSDSHLYDDGDIYLLETNTKPEDSVATSELSSSTPTSLTAEDPDDQEKLLAFNNDSRPNHDRRIFPAPIPFETTVQADNNRPLIFHLCYAKSNQILPQCRITLTEMNKMVDNYEKLSADDNSRVPDKYYDLAFPFVRRRPEHTRAEAVRKAEQSKTS